MSGPRGLSIAVAALVAAAAAFVLWIGYSRWTALPPPGTPEGAYAHVAAAIGRGEIDGLFGHLDENTQRSLQALRGHRKAALARVLAAYPEPERGRLAARYEAEAGAADGAALWGVLARRNFWVDRLRKDLSGVKSVEPAGEGAAVVETARATRYPFARRADGGWGLALFLPEVAAMEERAAIDLELVEQAAKDYEHGR